MNKADQSKLKLTRAMLDLLGKKSFSEISIQDIVDLAGVSRMAFYRNYHNKIEIVRDYVHQVTQDFIVHKEVDYDERCFHDYLVVLFEHLKEQEQLGRLLYRSKLLYLVKDEFDEIFASKAKSLEKKYNYCFIAGGLYNIYYYWLAGGCRETPEALAEMFVDFWSSGQC